MSPKIFVKVKSTLSEKKEFSSFDEWNFEKIQKGIISPIKFRLTLGNDDFFLKVIK